MHEENSRKTQHPGEAKAINTDATLRKVDTTLGLAYGLVGMTCMIILII